MAESILNADFDFELQAPFGDRSAFLSPPVKTKFEPGTNLYRFMTLQNDSLKHSGSEIFASPWWFSQVTFRELMRLAKMNQTGIKDAARARLAVPEKFNPTMDSFYSILLTTPAYGWVGRARGQARDSSRVVWYIGGAEQIYLPNLDAGGGMSSRYAVFQYFGWSEDLV